ncbi:ATP-dependent DNA helicase RecG [Arcanobacterium phocisimile]|uniref:Probable DNA 3'-5' helicase RecG n=1 Tax=Arcanobacterium phocisimile TaxID=1302235 RepID=A0ABX7IHG6_9ACTO|nr:ATP-dependent DNA helicase RecG [Arcanobacterium phocisimile]QRV01565.1 ATP-dependent DNA helicase RecG [Arcanobacterium phocisimile]
MAKSSHQPASASANDAAQPANSALPTPALASDAWTTLSRPLERVLGKRSANALAKLGLDTVEDLLNHIPFRIAQRGELLPLDQVAEGESVTVVANVVSSHMRPMNNRRGFILNVTISDGEHDLDLTFFAKHQRPLAFHETKLSPGTMATFAGTISSYRGRLQLAHPEYEIMESLEDLDAAQILRPVPIYHSTAKVPSWHIHRAVATILDTLSPGDVPDPLPQDYRDEHQLISRYDALRAVHQPEDPEQWRAARTRFAHEEAFVLQAALAQRAAQVAQMSAPACPPRPDGITHAFDQRLPFILTESQLKVGEELRDTLSNSTPMRCLLQGDVGAGKTIVALRAMLQVVDAGHQAVLVAPTEVLAQQHYATMTKMLGELGMAGQLGANENATSVHLLTGSLTASQRRRTLAHLASGAPSITVGTHALFGDQIQLPSLGFVVVDEQHRFGVDQRDKLAHNAHLLVMTATPIPRTIAMTVFGDLDVAVLDNRERSTISTNVVPAYNDRWMARVWQRAREEVDGGGKVFVVCPRISPTEDDVQADLVEQQIDLMERPQMSDVETLSHRLQQLPVLAGLGIGVLHGKMSSAEKTEAMAAFIAGQTQILVSTTVIEVGVDIPEATLMVIMDADRFGLSQLHQLRGRVGRGEKPGLCLAVTGAPDGTLAAERVAAFAATTDGFALAEADVALRSVGDVLGAQQSGTQSSLRFVSVVKDKIIIEHARQGARELIATDPDLTHHRALAIAIADINARNREYLEKS